MDMRGNATNKYTVIGNVNPLLSSSYVKVA